MHHNRKTVLITILAVAPILSITSILPVYSDAHATFFPGSDYCVVNDCTPEECAAVYPNDEAGYRVCTRQIGIPNVPPN